MQSSRLIRRRARSRAGCSRSRAGGFTDQLRKRKNVGQPSRLSGFGGAEIGWRQARCPSYVRLCIARMTRPEPQPLIAFPTRLVLYLRVAVLERQWETAPRELLKPVPGRECDQRLSSGRVHPRDAQPDVVRAILAVLIPISAPPKPDSRDGLSTSFASQLIGNPPAA